jgi:hypothetical protein
MGRHAASMEEMRNTYTILVGKPEGKGPLRRTRRRFGDTNEMNLREVECECVDWIQLVQNKDQWR